MVDAPEKIWIDQDDCPYFYEESELAEAGSPVTEYIRADLCHPPALEPSAARELALEEAARVCDAKIVSMQAHYDQTDNPFIRSNLAGDIALISHLAAAIRALSSPDHADAGKVEGDGCERCGGKGEIVVGKGRHGDTIIEDCPSCSTPQDVINLVIAAREACDTWLLPECEFKLLDKALEAFSERVPYENEPDALPSAPSEGAE